LISNPEETLELARHTLQIEADALSDLRQRLQEPTHGRAFVDAVDLMLVCQGRVIVSGIGKSGHVARKIASTLASTGTLAFFVHPAEASHGDLGMIAGDDVFLALSHSGESDELLRILPIIKRQGARVIAMSGNPSSGLVQNADVFLDSGVATEACPLNLAPTASTTAALALGDALAVALLTARGFGVEDFARSHPGGALGRNLLTHVSDVMHHGNELPVVNAEAGIKEVLVKIGRGGLGMVAVCDSDGKAIGIFTDGDLRRAMEKDVDLQGKTIRALMSKAPYCIEVQRLAAEAVAIMDKHRINQLLVVDGDKRLVGALNMHDLFRAKVI